MATENNINDWETMFGDGANPFDIPAANEDIDWNAFDAFCDGSRNLDWPMQGGQMQAANHGGAVSEFDELK